MSTNTKRILVIALCALVGLFVGVKLFQGLLAIAPAIAGGIIGGIVAAVLIKGPSVMTDIKNTVEAAVGKRPSETDARYVLEQALALNARARLEVGVSENVLTMVEQIIDRADGLVPQLCTNYQGDELTFNTCRIYTYHLPRLLDPYFALKVSDRSAAESGVVQALKAIDTDLADISKIFREQGIEAARRRAKTVEMKFSGFGATSPAAA